MDNITYRSKGYYFWREYFPGFTANHDRPDAISRVIARTQSSSGRPFPKGRPLPIHPYTLIYQDYILRRDVFLTYDADGHTEHAWGDWIHPAAAGLDPYKPDVNWSSLENRALDDLNEKTRGSLDLSVDIAEAHQLKRMFNYTKKVEDYTLTFTRKFGVIKLASQMWLEYTYGLKPLVSSVFGVADEMIRHVLNRTEKFRARASSHDLPKVAPISTLAGYLDVPIVGGSFKSSVTYGIELTTQENDLTRFSSLNPVSIAWELVPYSFVADWFLDVGGYLRNLETSLAYANRFRGGYKTRLATGELTLGFSDKGHKNGYVFSDQWTGSIKSTYISRSLLPSYPVPNLPSFKANLGSSRLLSAASLLGNVLSSGGAPGKLSPKLSRAVQSNVRKQQQRNQPVEHFAQWRRDYEHL